MKISPKFLIVGDLHLRKKAPELRKDDFEDVMWDKLRSIFKIADENLCDAIVFPGDVFDKHDVPLSVVEKAINIMHKSNPTTDIFFIFGQHDQRYHKSDKANTPLGVLDAGLNNRSKILYPEWYEYNGVMLWGASWGEDLPTEKTDKDCPHIVVAHKTITIEPLPWDNTTQVDDLMDMCPADVFFCGDNHAQFIYEKNNRAIFNMGSVMRTSVSQKEFTPKVGIWSVDDGIEAVDLSYEKDVFDLEKVEVKEERNEKIAKFVETFGKDFNPELQFKDNLIDAMKDAPFEVQELLKEVMEEEK